MAMTYVTWLPYSPPIPNKANLMSARESARTSPNAPRKRNAMMGRNNAAAPSMRTIVMNRLEMA